MTGIGDLGDDELRARLAQADRLDLPDVLIARLVDHRDDPDTAAWIEEVLA